MKSEDLLELIREMCESQLDPDLRWLDIEAVAFREGIEFFSEELLALMDTKINE